jgi:hypothetical protein
MRPLEALKRILGGRRASAQGRKRPQRRHDPDWSSLPGGSSAKEAEGASPERAGELAD